MPSFIQNITELVTASTFETIKILVVSYFGLLWLAIIIWVTRDSLHRSNSLIFQTFSILINIAIPFLGVILYLIIRPSQTNMERYYQEIEHRLLSEEGPDKQNSCEKCMTIVSEDYVYCPNCSEKLKNSCSKCRKKFPVMWTICPYCGTKHSSADDADESKRKAKK